MNNGEYVKVTNQLLQELFKECNEEFFNNNIPVAILKVTNGRKTLGACHVSALGLRKPTITVSAYYKVTRDDVKNTMIHEMIHLWEWHNFHTMSHGARFKLQAKRVELLSNKKFTITRLTSRKGYEVANPTNEQRFKNKLYAVFMEQRHDGQRAWIVACTSGMERVYCGGFATIWNMKLVGFVRDRFEPDFDRLPIQKSSHRIRGRVMPWETLNSKYPEFADCISA